MAAGTASVPKRQKGVDEIVSDAANALKRAARKYRELDGMDDERNVTLQRLALQAQRLALDLSEAALPPTS